MYLKLRELAEDIGINMDKLIENPDQYIDEYSVFIEKDWDVKIRKIRLAYGLPMESFSEVIGCDAQTLEHWEIAWTRPSRFFYFALKKAAIAAGIDMADLNTNPEKVSGEYADFIEADCGRKIQSIRLAYGLTLDGFGKLIGCTGEAVAKWEKDACIPGIKYYKTIEKLALARKITIGFLNEDPELFEDDYEAFCNDTFGTVVRRIRKAYDARQVDFADMLGVSGSTVRSWEAQRAKPSRKNYLSLKELAAGKGIDLHDT